MYSPHAFPGVAPGEQYDANANSSLLVVVQLESRSGVENVEKIAAVDGVDVLFIGRLSHSHGTVLQTGRAIIVAMD